VNQKADFFTKRIDSHNELNWIDSNRELECSTTRVGQYQKKHSPTQIHPDRQTSYINFLHLLRSMVYSSMAYVILQVN